jgi:hypothetical protein
MRILIVLAREKVRGRGPVLGVQRFEATCVKLTLGHRQLASQLSLTI